MLMAILLSPSGRGWWLDVQSVQGHEIDGLVFYTVDGSNYSVNDPQWLTGEAPRQRTVYYVPTQPSDGSLENTANQVLDWGSTIGPGVIGATLLAAGFVRRSRLRRRAASLDPHHSFGHGLPPATVKALLERNRRTGAQR